MIVIERVGAAALGTAMTVAAAAPSPVIGHFQGYPFEVASMIAALFAAFTTRVIIGLRAKSVAYALDAAVLVLVLITTAAIVIGWRTNLVSGLLYGTGFATIGEGIIRVAEKYTNRGLSVLGVDPPAPPPGTLAAEDDDHSAAISNAMGKLNKLPDTPPA